MPKTKHRPRNPPRQGNNNVITITMEETMMLAKPVLQDLTRILHYYEGYLEMHKYKDKECMPDPVRGNCFNANYESSTSAWVCQNIVPLNKAYTSKLNTKVAEWDVYLCCAVLLGSLTMGDRFISDKELLSKVNFVFMARNQWAHQKSQNVSPGQLHACIQKIIQKITQLRTICDKERRAREGREEKAKAQFLAEAKEAQQLILAWQESEKARLKKTEEIMQNEAAKIRQRQAAKVERKQLKQVEKGRSRQAVETKLKQAKKASFKQVEKIRLNQVEETRWKQVQEFKLEHAEEMTLKQAEEAKWEQAEKARLKQAEEARLKQTEEVRRKQAEEVRRKQAEEVRLRRVEYARWQHVEIIKRQQAEEARWKQAERARLRQVEHARWQQAEEARRKQGQEVRSRQVEYVRWEYGVIVTRQQAEEARWKHAAEINLQNRLLEDQKANQIGWGGCVVS